MERSSSIYNPYLHAHTGALKPEGPVHAAGKDVHVSICETMGNWVMCRRLGGRYTQIYTLQNPDDSLQNTIQGSLLKVLAGLFLKWSTCFLFTFSFLGFILIVPSFLF